MIYLCYLLFFLSSFFLWLIRPSGLWAFRINRELRTFFQTFSKFPSAKNFYIHSSGGIRIHGSYVRDGYDFLILYNTATRICPKFLSDAISNTHDIYRWAWWEENHEWCECNISEIFGHVEDIRKLIASVDHQTLHHGFHSQAVQVMSLNLVTAAHCCWS